MIRSYELIERVKAYDPHADEQLLNKAYIFSMRAHADQLRDSGDYYFLHPLEVALILCDFRLDCATIVTGLLHDTIEDTLSTLNDIEKVFGTEIARLVDGVTKLSKIQFQSEALQQAENFKKLILAMSADIRVLLVKLADRLHNMRTLECITNPTRRQRIANETLDIYVPLADRIGVYKIKDEMENLAFSHLYPDVYQSIVSRLRFLSESINGSVESVVNEFSSLMQKHNINSNISGRLKTPYSIWSKMQRKNVSLEQLFDVMAFRIIVDTIPGCYEALGVVHSSFSFIPGFFRDYISTPKPNKYQSIHTYVVGPQNYRIEIQIRTHTMHEISELGVAAHWHYKRPYAQPGDAFAHEGRQYAWLRGLLEIIEHASYPQEFLEHTKMEMFSDQVFCFTPKGELIPLPKGATPVDFAYMIHSELGDRTKACKINNKDVPLNSLLQNGDVVEIITSEERSLSPAWESFVATGRAKSKIRRYIRSRRTKQFMGLGRSLLEQACLDYNVAYSPQTFNRLVADFKCQSLDELFLHLGEGSLTPLDILLTAYPSTFMDIQNAGKAISLQSFTEDTASQFVSNLEQAVNKSSISTKGLTEGIAVHYASCCHPLPGDKIVGILLNEKGVRLHTADCETLAYITDASRILNFSWEDRDQETQQFVARLKVLFANKTGALAATTTAISKHGGNIVNLKVTQRSVEFWHILVDIEIRNTSHLEDIQSILRITEFIKTVERV